jgi:ABC-2 type transport system ATP-binding protein
LSSPAIEVRGLWKRYPKVRSYKRMLLRPFEREEIEALRGVDFTVRPGQVFGVLGPNGAGKTTLIKILTTLVLPSAGEARVFGLDIERQAAEVVARVGLVVSDERSFYWRLTVRQNLAFFATLNDLEASAARSRIDELLERLGCAAFADRPFRQLSAGIRQRIAVARAMLMDPPLLLLDEPTSSMDPRAAGEMRRWIRHTLVEEGGKTILLVTHDPLEAEFLCDEVAILRRGRIVYTGTPAQVLAGATGARSYRVVVSHWSSDVSTDLARAGLRVRTLSPAGDGRVELVLDTDGLELGHTLRLLAGRDIVVQVCLPVGSPFADAVTELLDERAGAQEPA